MKLFHLSDLHIGKRVNEFSMLEDQKYILMQILKAAKEHQPDGIILAGDIYDKPVPAAEAVQVFDDFLTSLNEMGLIVFMISGNHDSDERLNFGSSLFEANDVHIAAKYQGKLFHHVIEDAYGAVHIYQLPFVKASQVKRAFPEAKIETYEDAVREVLAHAEINQKQRNILVAHQFVSGKGKDPTLGGSEGALTQHVGTVEKIGYDCFDAFRYVALGHIHSSQSVGREEVRYAGSPLKYSLSEAGPVKQIPGGVRERDGAKQVPIVTVDGEGQVTIELEKLVPLRDLIHIRGTFTEIVKEENQIEHTEDFVYVTLTDEDIVPDAMRIMRQYYPNTIKLDYDNSRTRELSHVDVVQATQSRSYEELIGDFYKQMYGARISEEEMDMMKDVAKEVGIYEAD